MASIDNPTDADDKSATIVIDIDGDDEQTAQSLKEAGAPADALKQITKRPSPPRDQTPGRQVEFSTDGIEEVVQAPMPNFSSMPEPPKVVPTTSNHADMFTRKNAPWGDVDKNGALKSAEDLLKRPNPEEKVNQKERTDLTSRAEDVFRITDKDVSSTSDPEVDLPEINPTPPSLQLVPILDPVDDNKTPPAGIKSNFGHELSFPDERPVAEEPATQASPTTLPIRSTEIIDDKMIEGEEKDLKTENVGKHGFILPGAIIMNDSDMMDTGPKTVRRQADKVRASVERAQKIGELEIKRLEYVEKRIAPFNTLKALRKEIEALREQGAPIEAQYLKKNAELDQAKAELAEIDEQVKYHERTAEYAKSMLDKMAIELADAAQQLLKASGAEAVGEAKKRLRLTVDQLEQAKDLRISEKVDFVKQSGIYTSTVAKHKPLYDETFELLQNHEANEKRLEPMSKRIAQVEAELKPIDEAIRDLKREIKALAPAIEDPDEVDDDEE